MLISGTYTVACFGFDIGDDCGCMLCKVFYFLLVSHPEGVYADVLPGI